MPTYNIAITISTRVAILIKDAADRVQIGLEEPLSAQAWFIEEIRKLGVSIARTEYYEQKKEAGDPSKDAIDSEVTA
jgi:hypothetical protein